MTSLKIFFSVISIVITSTVMAQKSYKVGDIAADFSLQSVDGQMVSLSNYKQAKGFIVVFTSNTCPFSIAYEDRIQALNSKYASQGYPVIAIMPNNPEISSGDSMKAMEARAKAKGFTFPYVMDSKQEVYKTYGASRLPQIYVLQKTSKGNVVKYIGAIDDNYKQPESVNQKYVENAVTALLAKKPIKESHTRALGCPIK